MLKGHSTEFTHEVQFTLLLRWLSRDLKKNNPDDVITVILEWTCQMFIGHFGSH